MYGSNKYGSTVYGGVSAILFTVVTITAKGNIRATIVKTVTAKGNIRNTIIQTVTAKGNIARINEASLTAKAYIYNEVFETVRRIIPSIEIMWDGINWTDESTYFLSSQGDEQIAGINGQGIASTLDIDLDNSEERFTPDNTSSPLYGYIKPKTPIKVSITIGVTTRLFTGYIKGIHPNTKTRICSFECYDNQILVSDVKADGVVYQDNRSDQLLAVLAQMVGLTSSQYSFDVGVQTINYGYFEDSSIWEVMGQIAAAERGRIFFDRDGILKFWNREHLHNKTTSVTLTQNDWIIDLDYSVNDNDVKNDVIVQAKPRGSDGVQVVWSVGNISYLDPYTDTLVMVPAGGSQQATLEMENPCSLFIQPIANTDYIANSAQDGSGDDLTSDISITEFVDYGTSVFLNIVNTGARDAYLTTFQVRGNPIIVLKYIQVEVKDDNSISLYGSQSETIQNDFIQDESSASDIAYEELWRKQYAINNFKVDIVGIPYLICGDVISFEHKKDSYKNYMIDKLNWKLDDGGFKQTLTLVNPYVFPTIQRIDAKARIVSP
jgi:hypothetical protein